MAFSKISIDRTLVDPGDAPNRPVANRIVFEPLWRNLHVSHSLAPGATGFSDLAFWLLQDSCQFMDCRNSQITQPGRPLGTPDERKAVSRFDANPDVDHGRKIATVVISATLTRSKANDESIAIRSSDTPDSFRFCGVYDQNLTPAQRRFSTRHR